MRLLFDCLCVLAVSGCALPVALLDNSRPQSPKLIVLPLQSEAAEAMTRDEVRAKLGEPMLVGSNDEYYIYKVVVEDRRPVLYWVFPYTPLPLPEKLTHTQIVGVWFGADGRVEKIVEDMILNAQGAWWPPSEREVARLDRWMQEHRPPPRQPGSERAPAPHDVGGADDESLTSHAPLAHVERSTAPGVQPKATAVVVFDVPFGISVNRFQAANPLFGCRDASDRFRLMGDQFCGLGLYMSAACRSGETTEACRKSLRMAMNFLGVVSEEALASNSRPRALAQNRAAYFVDNRLGAVTWHFDSDACADVLRAVEARYGSPEDSAVEGDPPPGWGAHKMTNSVWRNSGAKLLVSLNPPGLLSRIGSCIVWIGTNDYEAEFTRRRAVKESSGSAAN